MSATTLSISAPRVRVSRAALARGIRAARDANPDGAIDLRRDACGHGADLVAEVAAAAGVRHAITDGGDAPRGLAVAPEADALDPATVFGLAGGTPAMTAAGAVLQTKPLEPGDGVSYGYLHRATARTRVALVVGGYAQGIARAIGGRTFVLLGGERCPIVGRVAMDVCVVDIGALPVAPGDEAVFFGSGAPDLLPAWCEATGWSPLEVVAAVGLGGAREVVA
ncbi:alanine racemase C-terminal domain-containing protein [Microbacterium excoecariae]|uniref:alanine racemase C-terminal domain-containing protein n=1 Tax=Microbacterium excoecariae TaxID=2715210 RepID=UPI00140C1E2E|nr:alanine racemase C-terminal domain-containing protein [Microbacterium excoecariae]NHI17180.1 alanine racemase [Microbacterium excoecariae]